MNLKEATLEVAAAYREGQVKRKTNAVPTTRRFLLEAIGCHPKAEPIAYFEYEDLYTVLRHAREAIETGSNQGLEQNTLNPDKWLEDLTRILDHLPNIPTPATPTLRPGCEPSLRIRTCRMPTIGVVAVSHYALNNNPTSTLQDVLQGLNITPDTSSTQILEATDPHTRNAPIPEDLIDLRDKLVPPQPDANHDSPSGTARLLHRLADRYRETTLSDLAMH